MKKILLLGILSIFVITLGAQTVTLPYDANIPPITKNAAQAIYDEAGITIIWENAPSERALILANEGKYDGDIARVPQIEAKFTNLMRVPTPLAVTATYAYVKNNSISLPGGIADLGSYKVGVTRGEKLSEAAAANADPNLVNEKLSLFKMLDAGRIDIMVAISTTTDPLLKIEGYENKFIKIEPPLIELPVFTYVHKKNEDLIPRLDAAVKKLVEDGTLTAILTAASN